MLEPTMAPSTPPTAAPLWLPVLCPMAAPMPPPMRAPASGSPAEAGVERVAAPRPAAATAITRDFFSICFLLALRPMIIGHGRRDRVPRIRNRVNGLWGERWSANTIRYTWDGRSERQRPGPAAHRR